MLARPLCLVGLRCTGKSTLGAALASALAAPFLDLDRELAGGADSLPAGGPIKSPTGPPPAEPPAAGELLARLGEPGFRELESRVLARLLELEPPAVIATGGGCVESPLSRALLRDRAITIWLRVPLDELARRMRADPTLRPALLGSDPVAEIPLVAARREPLYRSAAHHALDCGRDPIDVLVARIQALVDPR